MDIERAMRSGQMPRAIDLACKALDAGHEDPVLYNLRAHGRRRDGRLDEALDDLRRANALDPRSARILSEMANCLNAMGRYRQAEKAAGEAIDRDASLAEAWFHRAFALEMLNELEPARQGYLEALRLDPRIADAPARLASLAELRGETDEARKFAEQSLAIQPRHPVATLMLANLDLGQGDLASAEARLRPVLSDPNAQALVGANALCCLADIRDAQGRYGEAFRIYRDALWNWKASFAPRFSRPDGIGAVDIVRQSAAVISQVEVPAQAAVRTATARGTHPRLAFIMGFPRSGTTLLGQVLASHPGVSLSEERPLLARAIAELSDPVEGLPRLATLSEEEIDVYRADFWERAANHGLDLNREVLVEQTAFNTAYLPLIARLFPQARIVFAVRDPRDVVLSCFRRLFAPNHFTLELATLEGAAAFYDATMRLAETCRTKFDLAVLEIRNEDLIADFDGQTRHLCAHLGIDWRETLRDFHKDTARRTLITRSAAQVRRGLRADGVAVWRRYGEELSPVLPMLEPWVARFGYEPAQPAP